MNSQLFAEKILNVFFPPLCLVCRKRNPGKLCLGCREKIQILNGFYCPRCNRRLPAQAGLPAPAKNSCHSETKFILAAVSSYQNEVARELIHAWKYNRIKTAFEPLKEMMDKFLAKTSASFNNYSVVIPIPLHPKKEKERGFNQAQVIAEQLVRYLKNCRKSGGASPQLETNLLKRVRNTKSQTKLPNEERLKNIANCFALDNPGKIAGKNIILVDDVFTSGATIKEAVRILKNHGARAIIAFVIAKT